MDKLQATTKSIRSLIPSTDNSNNPIPRDSLVLDSPTAHAFLLKSFKGIGGELTPKSLFLIESSCRSRQITVEQAEAGLKHAFENCQYKPQWSDVLRGINKTAKGDQSIYRTLND